ncbi:MAG: flagellar biosynthetic protein FliR [Chloroflexota bacterium]
MIISVAELQMFFLAFCRIAMMMIFMPVLGGITIPTQVRLVTAILLTMVMLPWQPLPTGTAAMPTFEVGMAIVREMVVGFFVGYVAECSFGAIQVAANFLGANTGFAAGQILNPTFGSSGSAFDSLYLITATLIFLALDGHLLYIKAMAISFEVVPLNHALPQFSLEHTARMFATLVASGVYLALPVIAALVLTDVSAGLLARVAPQVQVYFLMIDVKLILSLVGVAIAFVITLPFMRDILLQMGPRGLSLIGTQ